MDLISIYKDDNQEVQIFDFAAEYLEFLANTYRRMSSVEAEAFLAAILNQISKQLPLKNKKIIATHEVPILTRKKIFNLVKEYSVLEDAVLLLSEVFDLTSGEVSSEWKDYAKNYIKAHYFLTFQKNCDIIFFSKKVCGASLVIILFDEDKIYILPIALNENDFYQRLA